MRAKHPSFIGKLGSEVLRPPTICAWSIIRLSIPAIAIANRRSKRDRLVPSMQSVMGRFANRASRANKNCYDMGIRSDQWIRRMVREHRMIDPFSDAQVRKTEKGVSVISYGLSSYGYDLRVSNEFKVFTNVFNTVVDPKAFDERSFVDFAADICVIPPNSFALARSVEYFRIPRDVLTVCLGKSTYARCGIIVNVTPLEPEWEGHVTLEISNTTPLPARIYAQEGLAQVIFLRASEICETSYSYPPA